ncbi:BlaI/MecI/CopY family transcriptional regulator [Dyella mobilis]|uniref:BlaI/MecI/CopY family transcriptional regulator n=1 Tax=Dyella mobilis TaxID=1849582 RepID=A0ABS2KCJ1_9GAMM|nr:BlaI/MecI/CopY family transcriptional regulator [Dyella mobilis]MBM7128882.1 BlaI/MecI/CopY family transcriptional regulator [Dyella mobilis]GLQ99427.1 BlaI family transcriptional regulator [Dyella mobilis]
MKIALTDREADVMQALWDHGPSLVAEVRERLSDELAYTTVLTVLRTLEGKGYVGHEEEGRGHRYFASIKQQAARKNAVQHLTEKLFKGSAELLFSHLVSEQKLSPEQIRRMRKLLAERFDEDESE